MKFVRLKEFNSIIMFPSHIKHSNFKHMNPVSAGFCYVDRLKIRVTCFGDSVSLDLKSSEVDSMYATKQVFGYDAL
jgi:hypothetical protein